MYDWGLPQMETGRLLHSER